MPMTKVEIAFGSGFRTLPADRVWTDVSDYVEGSLPIDISRGRDNEFSETQPATCTVTLDNRDGRFTPGNTAGAYYPNVVRHTPIRVSVTDPYTDLDADRYVGFITTWPVVWPESSDAYSAVTIKATVVLPRLAHDLLRALTIEEYLLDDPVACYPLGEPEGATGAADVSEFQQPVLTAEPFGWLKLGAGLNLVREFTSSEVVLGGVPSDDLLSARWQTTNAPSQAVKVTLHEGSVPTDATSFAVSLAMRSIRVTQGAAMIILNDASVSLPHAAAPAPAMQGIELSVDADGHLRGIIRTGANGATKTIENTGVDICDVEWHHVLVEVTRGVTTSTARYYVDGALVLTGTPFANHSVSLDRVVLGGVVEWEPEDTGVLGELAAVAHVAVFNTALGAERIADHAEAVIGGFAGDRTDERIERLATYVGLEDLVDTSSPGTSRYVPLLATEDKTPLELMRVLERGEGGVLFDGRDGSLVFHGRGHRSVQRVAVSLSAASQQINGSLSPVLDDFGLVNDITVTSTDPSVPPASNFDAASRLQHGPYRESVEIPTTSPHEVVGYARVAISRRAEPEPRISQLTVDLDTLDEYDVSDLLVVDVGSLIELTQLPDQAPASTMLFFVEGYSESLTSTTHQITFNLSPAEDATFWALGDEANSVLGSTTRLSY